MTSRFLAYLSSSLLLTAAPSLAGDWWNKDWTQRQKITVDAGSDGANLAQDVDGSAVLVRLYEGNFQFPAANPDGSDLRFINAEGKTLPYHIEKYDSLINEAFVWVKVPHLAAGGKTTLEVYYGNPSPSSVPAGKPADVYDASLVYHFSDRGGSPADASANANTASDTLTSSEGAIIGSGAHLLGGQPVVIAASPSLEWSGPFTWSAWLKPASLQPQAVVFSRSEGGDSFRIVLDQGVPVVEITSAGATRRSPVGQPVAAGSWSHIAVTGGADGLSLYVNGEPVGKLDGAVPAFRGSLFLAGLGPDAPSAAASRFVGEIDELVISKEARTPSWIKLAAVTQGTTPAAQKAVALGEVESSAGGPAGHSKVMEHVMLFGDIAKNMMFDGWIAIGLCVVMIGVGWTVAVRKFVYLSSITKGSREFLRQWKQLSSDLTALDHADASSVNSFGGQADASSQALLRKSPLYHIYHIGSEEIRHRLLRDKDRTKGLSGRSIQAIRAALDGGLVHETHRLTKGLVFLTISIAGGPYVGLLGTVVGVMITFAIIAKSGEVDVNSIAPGIASALLATVAGLVVAIPALFIYSYLNSRIKETTSGMQVFIDEFVAKMAEFYPPAGESSPYAPPANDKTA
ncbi:MAG: biopolymer transporter ExbB [Akkermansiaceae bacterium]|nr:biopolymer transporter ExbB [Akkermansiaceae bacterium]